MIVLTLVSLGTIKASQAVVLNEDSVVVTHINSVILILKLNLTSLRNIYIEMYVVLNEDHF